MTGIIYHRVFLLSTPFYGKIKPFYRKFRSFEFSRCDRKMFFENLPEISGVAEAQRKGDLRKCIFFTFKHFPCTLHPSAEQIIMKRHLDILSEKP